MCFTVSVNLYIFYSNQLLHMVLACKSILNTTKFKVCVHINRWSLYVKRHRDILQLQLNYAMETNDNHIPCSCCCLNFMLVCCSCAWLDDWDNFFSCYAQGHSKLQPNYVMATANLPCRTCSFEVIFHADFLSQYITSVS